MAGPAALGPAVHALAAIVAGAALAASRPPGRWASPSAAALAVGLAYGAALLALVLTGLAARDLLDGAPPAARASLGAGFWIGLAALCALLGLAARGLGGPGAARIALLLLVGGAGLAAALGAFDALSLAVEFRARSGEIGAGLLRHAALAAAALGLALALALPLGGLASVSPRLGAGLDAALGAVQVIPAIALFGLLVPMLAILLAAAPGLRAWGVAAIGPAPAVIGVAAYLLLPLVRGLAAGLASADPAACEAARAMGYSRARVLREIRVPLGLPVLGGALRVAAVQAVGLTTLGGLVGAGGLGALVFDGMAQFAPDLILLSAIPVVLLGVAVDAGLGLLLGAGARR